MIVQLRRSEHGRRMAALADVLVDVSANPPAARCAELFATYPGLTAVLLPRTRKEIIAGVRDGSLLRLCSARPDPVTAARLVYEWWARRIRPDSSAAQHSARSAGFAIRCGRWRPEPGRWQPEPGKTPAHARGSGGAESVEDPQG